MLTATLANEYRRVCGEPSDIVAHLPRFVAMSEAVNAQHVIELGTRTGVSTIAWLYALERTGGRLTSVDIDERPDLGEHDHWTFIRSHDLDPETVAGLDEADIVFIDTSHFYEQTLAELNVYRHLCRGLIVLHDTMLEHPIGAPLRPRFPVLTAVTDFCAAENLEWRNYEDCWGLGVIKL